MNDQTFHFLKELLLDGTGLGVDGPNHDLDLALPEHFSQDDKAKPSAWDQIGRPGFDHLEPRGLAVAAQDEWPTDSFPIEVADVETYSYNSHGWELIQTMDLTRSNNHGGWLGDTRRPDHDPYQITQSRISWNELGPDHFSADWQPGAIMGHFWGASKAKVPAGHFGEVIVGVMRLGRLPEGNPPPRILGGLGLDYYPSSAHNSKKAAGPGIQRSKVLGTDWMPFGWITAGGVPWQRDAVDNWIDEHGLPESPKFLQRIPEGQTTPPPDPTVVGAEFDVENEPPPPSTTLDVNVEYLSSIAGQVMDTVADGTTQGLDRLGNIDRRLDAIEAQTSRMLSIIDEMNEGLTTTELVEQPRDHFAIVQLPGKITADDVAALRDFLLNLGTVANG